MKNYYVSKYLNIIPLKDTYLLFNGFNGCIDEVSKEMGQLLSNKDKVVSSQDIADVEIEFLQRRGHVTNLTPEEEKKEFVKFVKKIDEFNLKNDFSECNLMLLLSYACNLNCYYCYQKPIRGKKENKVMTKEFVDQLFGIYFEKLYRDVSREDLDITLYGGEPFLKRNRDVVERVLEYSNKYSINVGAISNCTQLEHYLDLVGPLPGQINFIQVSIDGNQEDHDTSRVSEPGKPTFDTIVRNIHLMLDRKVKLNIRINIDANSLEKLAFLYDFLEKEEILNHPYAYIYLHPLHNHFKQTDDSSFVGHMEAAATIESINIKSKIRHPIRRKAEGLAYLMKIQRGIPFRKTRFCMQNIPNNFLIDPYGDIYGCYEEAGRDDYKIGYLKNGEVYFNSLREDYLNRNLLNLDKCLECSISLLCAGECGVQARENNGSIYNPYCSTRKDEIYEAIKYIYTEREQDDRIDSLNFLFPHL
ncbi:radical SAM/SPASM domain-containing protein [Lutispora thermophila]|uniref:Radical SAM additional 4Fe4S-binding SPASM domain-containing protein n=1 Tax=Lutispora thermophila DSM 19022 TaxID=1122184 RepID=A0A1M6DPU5_9FIRM|nr:SPASM domain-containing protein [Lutispora thermophila]SHI75241.1 radical SAM additional 4Fe4S-binding SPASM domain-containing protein [Lutispora thermophila DSM 19022]